MRRVYKSRAKIVFAFLITTLAIGVLSSRERSYHSEPIVRLGSNSESLEKMSYKLVFETVSLNTSGSTHKSTENRMQDVINLSSSDLEDNPITLEYEVLPGKKYIKSSAEPRATKEEFEAGLKILRESKNTVLQK